MKLLELIESIWIEDLVTTTWLFHRWWAYSVVPIMLYLMFLCLKWLIISVPIWLPIVTIAGAFRKVRPEQKSEHIKS